MNGAEAFIKKYDILTNHIMKYDDYYFCDPLTFLLIMYHVFSYLKPCPSLDTHLQNKIIWSNPRYAMRLN